MPIPKKVAALFTPALRASGEGYVREGRVTLVHRDPSYLTATVEGTQTYKVELRAFPGDRLDLRCSCPYALEYGNCKHLWAVLVVADRAGALPHTPDEAYHAEARAAREAEREAERKLREAREAAEREAEREAAARALEAAQIAVPQPAVVRAPEVRSDPRPWVQRLRALAPAMAPAADAQRRESTVFPEGKRIIYVVDVPQTMERPDGLWVELALQTLQKTGEWGSPRQFRLTRAQWFAAPDPIDREIAHLLLGAQPEFGPPPLGSSTKRFLLAPAALDTTLRRMCESGRCLVRAAKRNGDLDPLAWDDGAPWDLRLAVTSPGERAPYRLQGHLERDGEAMSLEEPLLLMRGGLLLARGMAGRFIDHGAFDLVPALRTELAVEIPRAEGMDLLAELHALPHLPPLEVPPELQLDTVDAAPRQRLALRLVPQTPWTPAKYEGTLTLDYDGAIIDAGMESAALFQEGERRIVRRNRAAEAAIAQRLDRLGFRWEYDYATSRNVRRIAEGKGEDAALVLTDEGWWVEFEGRALRMPGDLSVEVRSGIDWFDLDATLDFGGVTADLPTLLAALRRGQRTVKLSDNSLGMLSSEWLERSGLLAAAGTMVDGHLRFSTRQLGILDVLLSALPPADTDAAFEHARSQLLHFEGIKPARPPKSFRGTLRPYQEEGLGWLHFLRQFGFGGCLADDMGLGKTVQVLALLEARRAEKAGTSLVVVPRSLVFNWEQEAARFTPKLKVLVHGGPERQRGAEHLEDYDLVLTTYGTLRRDVAEWRDFEFDYAILDEAQAIKNARTESAKAARLLRAKHRLAMTGTPIENRLAELWSLLEFLNPGLLGRMSVFGALVQRLDAPGHSEEREESRALLSRAVRPYILRRTKAQVAPELPERLEQTLVVELSAEERALYDELRDHYRRSLLGRLTDEEGIGKHRMHVLEALLRLRQAACHPGLVDPERRNVSSSKIDMLLTRVGEAIAEDHKVLVFSQFTSLLSIVKTQMDASGMVYEYLDGETKDRQRPVERFQTDPDCKVFLVSLKAGGLGLNLTAAEYVYLLDPWWNPAVEAQAIDRAHRIGQTRRVFAQRLIARDTVEEKVLALQESKRDLADAIIRADNSVIASLGKEELELLLS
ncbi:MAG: SNF2-related protein [Gemmatimonadota bacterium]